MGGGWWAVGIPPHSCDSWLYLNAWVLRAGHWGILNHEWARMGTNGREGARTGEGTVDKGKG